MYSFGMLLWQLVNKGKDPYEPQVRGGGLRHDDMVKIIAGTMRPDVTAIPATFEHVTDLMQQCWVSEPEQRPTMATCVSVIEGWEP